MASMSPALALKQVVADRAELDESVRELLMLRMLLKKVAQETENELYENEGIVDHARYAGYRIQQNPVATATVASSVVVGLGALVGVMLYLDDKFRSSFLSDSSDTSLLVLDDKGVGKDKSNVPAQHRRDDKLKKQKKKTDKSGKRDKQEDKKEETTGSDSEIDANSDTSKETSNQDSQQPKKNVEGSRKEKGSVKEKSNTTQLLKTKLDLLRKYAIGIKFDDRKIESLEESVNEIKNSFGSDRHEMHTRQEQEAATKLQTVEVKELEKRYNRLESEIIKKKKVKIRLYVKILEELYGNEKIHHGKGFLLKVSVKPFINNKVLTSFANVWNAFWDNNNEQKKNENLLLTLELDKVESEIQEEIAKTKKKPTKKKKDKKKEEDENDLGTTGTVGYCENSSYKTEKDKKGFLLVGSDSTFEGFPTISPEKQTFVQLKIIFEEVKKAFSSVKQDLVEVCQNNERFKLDQLKFNDVYSSTEKEPVIEKKINDFLSRTEVIVGRLALSMIGEKFFGEGIQNGSEAYRAFFNKNNVLPEFKSSLPAAKRAFGRYCRTKTSYGLKRNKKFRRTTTARNKVNMGNIKIGLTLLLLYAHDKKKQQNGAVK